MNSEYELFEKVFLFKKKKELKRLCFGIVFLIKKTTILTNNSQ